MNMQARVSIIVPVFNIENYITKCVDSLISQTYDNIEVILVNDGSSDNSASICHKYEKIDRRIKVIDKKNGGLSSARNTGIKEAQGEYLVFVDGDDYVHPEYIEKLFRSIINSGADIAVCGISIVDKNNEIVDKLATGKAYKLDNPFCDEVLLSSEVERRYYKNKKQGFWYVVAWNKIYKASIFESIKYDEGMIYEDEFLFHQLIRCCRKISFIPDELYYYVQRNNGITSEKKDSERFHFLTEIYERRMSCYIQESNVELQKLCTEKYLRQIISKYRFLDGINKKVVMDKYRYAISTTDVGLIYKFIFPFVGFVSLINRYLKR